MRRLSGSDRLGEAGGFVAAQIIEQDNVARRQCRRQRLLDIGTETLAVDCAIEHTGHADPGCAQTGDQGSQLPVSLWDRSP